MTWSRGLRVTAIPTASPVLANRICSTTTDLAQSEYDDVTDLMTESVYVSFLENVVSSLNFSFLFPSTLLLWRLVKYDHFQNSSRLMLWSAPYLKLSIDVSHAQGGISRKLASPSFSVYMLLSGHNLDVTIEELVLIIPPHLWRAIWGTVSYGELNEHTHSKTDVRRLPTNQPQLVTSLENSRQNARHYEVTWLSPLWRNGQWRRSRNAKCQQEHC